MFQHALKLYFARFDNIDYIGPFKDVSMFIRDLPPFFFQNSFIQFSSVLSGHKRNTYHDLFEVLGLVSEEEG